MSRPDETIGRITGLISENASSQQRTALCDTCETYASFLGYTAYDRLVRAPRPTRDRR